MPAGEERVIARMRPHGRVLVVPVLVLWACAGLVALLLDRVDWPLWNVAVLTVAGIVVAVLTVVPTLAWLSRGFTFTTERVIIRTGFGGTRRETMLSRVHDVTVRRRGLQALFGAGDVLLSTGGDRAVILSDVPSASLVQRMLSELLGARGVVAPDVVDVA
ncbi:PH domain-containing protein [Agrococcus sediminis]|uniref:PH domain-containing protein n=1 Tax=Agrococcus TaxID=46352 RepID=UPI0013E40B3B|nr:MULTISPECIES: PH domain-containing protein [Agrococcus]MDR7235077.1 membrane protein YdbS with pleckstrin-like domain [Agrococcus sp. BE272]UOW01192.1 PH domain-containing protein [Agrococcus sp. SCSIO52902]